jgi:hypothetical protein
MTGKTTEDDDKTEVFDVSNWLDQATGKRPPSDSEYVPKHRAEEPAV